MYKAIGAVIRTRRKTQGLRQEDLAQRLGISRGALANIEAGRQGILVHQLYNFAEILDVTPADLLPTQAASLSHGDWSELPLPDGLNASQKEQIARLFDAVTTESGRSREDTNVRQSKR